MLKYTTESTKLWYNVVIKEQERFYRNPVEGSQLHDKEDKGQSSDKEKVLVDLRNDYAFKLLFGSKGNERILIEFLNLILKLPPEKQIQKIAFQNTEVLKEYDKDKKPVLDILVLTNDGDYINIEIQLCNKYDMPARSLYYSAKLISKEVQEGENYIRLKRTVTINIVNFNQFSTVEAFHTRFEMHDSESRVTLTDRLQIHFVELPKFLKQWRQGKLDPCEDRLTRWLLLLEASEDGTILTELEEIAMQQDPVLAEALDKWNEMSRDPEVRMAYFLREKQLMDEAVGTRDAEIRGEIRGEARVIKSMLSNGVPITQISQMTGLTLGEIERIQLLK